VILALFACNPDRGPLAPAAPASAAAPEPAAPAAPEPSPAAGNLQDPAIARAREAFDRGDLVAAHDAFLAAVTAGPRGAECLYEAGRASLRLGHAERGREELERAIAAIERATGAALHVAWAEGFGSWAEGVAWSPNGALVGVAGRPDVVIFDARTLTERVRLGPPRSEEMRGSLGSQLKAIAWSPDSAAFAAGTPDQSALLGEVFTGRRLPSPTTHTRAVYGVAFSAEGGLFASSGLDDTTRVVRLADRREVKTIKHECPADAGSIFFLDRGRSLAVRRCGTIRIESLRDGGKGRSFAERPQPSNLDDFVGIIAHAELSDEVLAGRGPRVQAFNASTGAPSGTWTAMQPPGVVDALDVSADGRTVAAGSNIGHLRVFRREGDTTLFESDAWGIPYVAFDPGGGSLAVAQSVDLKVLDLAARATRTAARVATTRRMATRKDVVALLEEGAVRVWNISDAWPPLLIPASAALPSAVALSDDARLLAVGEQDGGVRLWSLDRRAELWARPKSPAADAVTSLSFDAAARRVLSVARRVVGRGHHFTVATAVVTVRDVAGGGEIAQHDGGGAPCGVFFARSGKDAWLVTEQNEIVRLPRASGSLGQPSRSLGDGCVVARDPTRDVVAHGRSEVVLANLATGAVIETLPVPGGTQVEHLAFSDDGKRLAAVLRDGDLAIWTVGSHASGARHPGPARHAVDVAFSADGRALLVASWDGGLTRWPEASKAPALTLLGTHGNPAGFGVDAGGHVELFGADMGVVLCGFGAVSFPFDLCRHRLERGHLLPP
jgi:WD40 repeat protein